MTGASGIEVVEMRPVQPPERVVAALSEVIDPELGLDIVSLGLVYELHLVGDAVTVAMTLTTPGCPMHGSIRQDVLRTLERLDGIGPVDVQLVWDPPWSPDRIDEEGRRRLTWL